MSYHCTSLLSLCLSQDRYAFDIAKDEGMKCIVCDGGSQRLSNTVVGSGVGR